MWNWHMLSHTSWTRLGTAHMTSSEAYASFPCSDLNKYERRGFFKVLHFVVYCKLFVVSLHVPNSYTVLVMVQTPPEDSLLRTRWLKVFVVSTSSFSIYDSYKRFSEGRWQASQFTKFLSFRLYLSPSIISNMCIHVSTVSKWWDPVWMKVKRTVNINDKVVVYNECELEF